MPPQPVGVKSLTATATATATAQGLIAESQQIDATFAEQVAKGSYKKSPPSSITQPRTNNLVPGVYDLRHVGFLRAQPPAVKGLRAIAGRRRARRHPLQ